MKILMVVGTNFELNYLSSVAHLLRSKGPFLEFTLMLRRIFEKNITSELKSLYSRIELFDIPTLSFPISKNPLRTFQNFIENLRDSFRFQAHARGLTGGFDIVCICGFREFFANIMARQAPKRTRLVVLRLANQRLEETREFKKRPFLSFLLNLKNRMFGYSPMEYKFKLQGGLDPLVKNFVRYPYHRTISITDYDIGSEGTNSRLPPPFMALKKLYKLNDAIPAILLAGDKTPFYEGWTKEDEKTYESVFDFLRKNFPEHKLYFKPKMGKTDPTKYNLEGFEILSPEISFEEVCLRKNIQKVISIRSTSSKVGAYFGIPSYMLYPLFQIPESLKQEIENEHYDIQSVVRVKKIEDLLKEPNLFIKEYDYEKLANLYWEAII